MNGPTRERGGLPDAAGGGPPSTSVDVLAAQVRAAIYEERSADIRRVAFEALDALVARVTEAGRRADVFAQRREMWEKSAAAAHAALGVARSALERTIDATASLLPLNGSSATGYRISERIDSVLAATPEEWATAAQAVIEAREVLARLGNQP